MAEEAAAAEAAGNIEEEEEGEQEEENVEVEARGARGTVAVPRAALGRSPPASYGPKETCPACVRE